jgi:hypothetical protein
VNIPQQFREDADAFPPALRALLDAELAAGNQIVEAGHSFPAPPAGAYFKLSRPVTTRGRVSADGLKFWDYKGSSYSGSFTDDRGFFHILEPPLPPPPEPDMDAIRAAHTPKPMERGPSTAYARFVLSMEMNYEKWHDGIGYDLDALKAATPAERGAIEALLVHRGIKDWRDVEALAVLDTPDARKALQAAMEHRDPQIRLAVTRHAPELVADPERVGSLVKALETADLFGGLSQALDEAAEFHPKEVVDALFRGALKRDGEAAVNIAGLLLFVYGKADEPFDWAQRPFFLRFHTENQDERRAVFVELCEKVGVEASEYL